MKQDVNKQQVLAQLDVIRKSIEDGHQGMNFGAILEAFKPIEGYIEYYNTKFKGINDRLTNMNTSKISNAKSFIVHHKRNINIKRFFNNVKNKIKDFNERMSSKVVSPIAVKIKSKADRFKAEKIKIKEEKVLLNASKQKTSAILTFFRTKSLQKAIHVFKTKEYRKNINNQIKEQLAINKQGRKEEKKIIRKDVRQRFINNTVQKIKTPLRHISNVANSRYMQIKKSYHDYVDAPISERDRLQAKSEELKNKKAQLIEHYKSIGIDLEPNVQKTSVQEINEMLPNLGR